MHGNSTNKRVIAQKRGENPLVTLQKRGEINKKEEKA